ncbi:MAG: hypothetical protein RIT14_953, partial [Pseudomonadota bacterium]
ACLVSASLWGLPFGASPARADDHGPGPATITVTGEGMVEAVPDLATVSLGVTTEGATASGAMEANSQALQKVMARIEAAGIEARDVQTSNLSLNPNWQSTDGTTSRIVGYVASNILTVRVRDLDRLGGVLDAVIADGANTLNGISFGLSEPDPALDRARVQAVTEARARAELLAGAAGAKLGRILSISESGPSMPQPLPMYRMEAAMADAVPVAAGEVGVTAYVTLTFEIVQP